MGMCFLPSHAKLAYGAHTQHTDRRRQTAAIYIIHISWKFFYFSNDKLNPIWYCRRNSAQRNRRNKNKREKRKKKNVEKEKQSHKLFSTPPHNAHAAETKRHKTEHVVGISIFRSSFARFSSSFFNFISLSAVVHLSNGMSMCLHVYANRMSKHKRAEWRKRRKAKSKRYYANSC